MAKKKGWMMNPALFTDVGVPNEIRTRVTAVKGRCPRPLDDGDNQDEQLLRYCWWR